MTEKPPHIHVAIKSFEHKYWEDIAALFQCPKCNWGTLQLPYQSKDDIKKKLENPPQGMHRLIAVLPEEDTAIGMLGIHPSHGRRAHSAYLGMFVHDDYQGAGVGSALMEAAIQFCDQWLNLRRLELHVYVDNLAARRLYDKFGFEQEGIAKEYAYRDGEFVDSYIMARLRHRTD